MRTENSVLRMKELVGMIAAADEAYYRDDKPIMSDREYDALTEELSELEKSTGIVFANSPTRRVSGSNKVGLAKARHTKPMLSAKKTKSEDEFIVFASCGGTVISRKLDGLTLVLRYSGGEFRQALTRGEDGLVGEDVTEAVRYLRNVPKKVKHKGAFEVRGEGVVSWADFRLLTGNSGSHPRNVAAGAVRALSPDTGTLAHIDFFAFELIGSSDESETKIEQLDFLSLNGFDVVEHTGEIPRGDGERVREAIAEFAPEDVLTIALLENIQREDLNPIEEATAFQRLIDDLKLKQEEIAERVSKKRSTITNSMRLLKLPEEVKKMVAGGQISEGHGRALLGLEDKEEIVKVAKKIAAESWSVRATEEYVKKTKEAASNKTKKKSPVIKREAVYREAENKMKRSLGAKVEIKKKNDKSGKIEISYYSIDELERLIELFEQAGKGAK